MNNEEKMQLTKEWVMTMLYKHPMTLDELITNGCRIMVYDWHLSDFRAIILEMVKDSILTQNASTKVLTLHTDGIFYIKKHTLLPLIQLSEHPELLAIFIDENKEKCDTVFLDMLSKQPTPIHKENAIQEFAQNHYGDIAKILTNLIPFLSTNT